jgi:WD40 repeat protein
VKVWDAATGQETLTLKGHSSAVWSVSFSPDGERIVSGSSDNTVKVWNAETEQEAHTLKGHSGPVHSVSFSPDGERIVSGSSDNTLKVWDAETGQETLTLIGHAGLVRSVSFSRDGERIVSGSWDSTVKVWDAETRLETLTLKGHLGSVYSVSFSPDGERIVSGSGETDASGLPGQVLVWNAVTGQPTEPQPGDAELLRPDNESGTTSDTRIVVAEGLKLLIKDSKTGEVLFSAVDDGEVISPRFSPDGKRIVSGCSDGTVKVWLQAARSAPRITDTSADTGLKKTTLGTANGAATSKERHPTDHGPAIAIATDLSIRDSAPGIIRAPPSRAGSASIFAGIVAGYVILIVLLVVVAQVSRRSE